MCINLLPSCCCCFHVSDEQSFKWIRPQTSILEVPSSIPSQAVVPLGKALYPHCLVPQKGLKVSGPIPWLLPFLVARSKFNYIPPFTLTLPHSRCLPALQCESFWAIAKQHAASAPPLDLLPLDIKSNLMKALVLAGSLAPNQETKDRFTQEVSNMELSGFSLYPFS